MRSGFALDARMLRGLGIVSDGLNEHCVESIQYAKTKQPLLRGWKSVIHSYRYSVCRVLIDDKLFIEPHTLHRAMLSS